jgi:ubiquitin carboxyl-terminal hydrolase 22/27/51
MQLGAKSREAPQTLDPTARPPRALETLLTLAEIVHEQQDRHQDPLPLHPQPYTSPPRQPKPSAKDEEESKKNNTRDKDKQDKKKEKEKEKEEEAKAAAEAAKIEPIYTLSSVIVHKGKIDSGHYVSYARQGEEWFRFDDSMVVRVEEREVLGAEAYMLFYCVDGV